MMCVSAAADKVNKIMNPTMCVVLLVFVSTERKLRKLKRGKKSRPILTSQQQQKKINIPKYTQCLLLLRSLNFPSQFS